jgi:tetratricopeptide (TPR) repeat protein
MQLQIRMTRLPMALPLAFGLCLAAGAANADGGGGNDSPSSYPTCPKGQIYNSAAKRCEQQRSGVLPDKELAYYAYVLAKHDRYDEAIDVLNLMQNPNTAEALNYRGYATRHLGKLDEGIRYYLQSVALDPNYAQVREYLGEAYVIKGDLASANAQLIKIKAICGNTECEEYEDLEKAIAGKGNEG